MIKYVHGDLLTTNAPLILHQVNLNRVIGGGLAYKIARKYPSVEREYSRFHGLLGDVLYSQTDDFIVGNCYSQTDDFTTNYDALFICLLDVRKYMLNNKIDTVAIPYKYGCGIAYGDWAKVKKLFKRVLGTFTVLIYKFGD